MKSSRLEVASFPKNASEEVRIALDTFNGHRLADVRVFWKPEGAADFCGTKRGLSLRACQLRPLIQALRQAEVAAAASGWIEQEGGADG